MDVDFKKDMIVSDASHTLSDSMTRTVKRISIVNPGDEDAFAMLSEVLVYDPAY